MKQFYNENFYKWFPRVFYSANNSNIIFTIAIEKRDNDEKLFGYVIEKQSQHMIALANQIYTDCSSSV
jgi:hypothetical protein